MTIIYRLPGVISSIGLVIYTLLVLIILNAYDITLTLPGIAGIILGIGMAVDANVIIFARVKEEIGGGAKIDNALRAGFKKAFSAILDGNVTTLIAAIVLFILGSGSVKGFAQTLGIGILVSMFTALVAVRWIMYSVYTFGAKDKKFYGEKKMRDPYNFVGNMKKWFAIAGAVILGIIYAVFTHGPLGVYALICGVGAVISMILVIFILPSMLMAFDGLIKRTTAGMKKSDTIPISLTVNP